MKKFVLVGGSALALYLCHRKSEDLDFFSYENVDLKEVIRFLRNFNNKEYINISEQQIDLFIDGVKVTFFNAKWKFLKPTNIEKFNVATLEQIAIMKVNVLFLRAKYRDYYDLYFLLQHFDLNEIYKLSKDVLDGINFKLFINAIIYIDDIEDENITYLEPIKNISLFEIRDKIEQKIKKELL
jgi:predicted nucleotidyltransferase component of viral defense system